MDLEKIKSSLTIRFVSLLVLVIALAVPTAMVYSVVLMRSDYQQQVALDISQGWGGTQTLIGPVLQITTQEKRLVDAGADAVNSVEQTSFFTPEVLTAHIQTEHEMRSKGIFSKPVYVGSYSLSGQLGPNLEDLKSNVEDNVNIKSCSLLLVLSDTRSLKSLSATYNGNTLDVEPTTQISYWGGEAVHAPLSTGQCKAGNFQIELVLRGSNRQALVLVGDESHAKVSSTWPHPKFDGRQLPDHHDITDQGFTAEWTSNALARGFPSSLSAMDWQQVSDVHAVGYSFYEPVTLYVMVERAVKYGFFVVGLTILAIFCVELITVVRFHLIQYGVVGAGLALFYLLLLSISEHVGFDAAYVVASAILVSLVTGYAWVSSRHVKLISTIAVLLVGIYTALYFCISSADYALLIGTILLVALLVGLMYATRGLALTKVQ